MSASNRSTISRVDGQEFLLRHPRLSDAPQLMRYVNSLVDENAQILVNEPQTLKQEIAYITDARRRIRARQRVQYLLFDQKTLVGNCQIDQGRYREAHLGTFGISLAASYRRQGLGYQLAQKVIEKAQVQLAISLLKLSVYAENLPALALYRKLGFQEYGRLPEGIRHGNTYIDQIYMYKKLE